MSTPYPNRLREWRLKQLETVAALAAKIPCARQTWHSWERGASIPPPQMMARLVLLTGGAVQPNDFYPVVPVSQDVAA